MKLRRLKQKRRASGAFESEFAVEILKSDKLRVTILICFFGVAVPTILLLSIFAFEDFQRIFHGNFKNFLMIVLSVLGLGLACFTVEWLAIDRRIKEQRKASPLLPYLSALVETSIPLAALLVTAQYVGPAYALLTPAPFMYPLLIVLSTLRLDFKLSVFTGAVAAIQ
jgi:adenylate cyclase